VPNAPTFASPGDTFDISVTVTNNDKGSGSDASVVLSAVPTAHFSITSAQSVTLKIPEGRDATATFGIKTNDVLGAADIAFTAKGASHSSRITSSMSVRPSMPYQVWLTSGRVTKDKASVDVDKKMYNEYATREIALSYLPSGLAKGLQFYLEKYPYGCSEQQVSMAYPYLFPDLLKESGKTKADAQEAIDNVVVLIQDEPDPEMLTEEDYDDSGMPTLLGLYDGVPLTERDEGWSMVLPDRILIFRGPLERWCTSREELEEEITVTVIHEVAHHFGIPDERLHELGWE